MKSHIWNLWGKKFIIDSTDESEGKGIEVGGRKYSVHIQHEGQWREVREDVTVGVLLSFLRRFDPSGRDTLLEGVPEPVRESMKKVIRQFGGRDAEANAYAMCVVSSQRMDILEHGTLRVR